MFTMLASMSSQIQYFEGLNLVQNTTAMIQKGLVATKRHIQIGAVDFRLVFGIHCLANAEFYRYNVQASRTHVAAVKAFIDQTGGLEALPRFLKEWFLSGDEFIAAESQEKPFGQPSQIDPGPGQNSKTQLCQTASL